MATEQTGHKLELSDATTLLVDALTTSDPTLIKKAASAHATALNSQATAMAASIAAPLYAQGSDIAAQVKELAEIVTNARQADLNWRSEERIQRDAQSDRLYAELDKLMTAAEDNRTRLGKHSDELAQLREGQHAVMIRLDRKRQELDQIHQELAELRAWRDAQDRNGNADR